MIKKQELPIKLLKEIERLYKRIISLSKKAEKYLDKDIKDAERERRRLAGTRLHKIPHNPIIKPNGDNWWESWQVFNPGVIHLDETTHIFYRSIGSDGLSRFGYAYSKDGLNGIQRLSYPVYTHRIKSKKFYYYGSGGSFGGCEDPRLTKVEEDEKIYMVYTACDGGLRVALTSIDVNDFIHGKWKWAMPKFLSPEGEVHKNWVIFPEKINGKYAILHSISPSVQIEYRDSLDFDEGEYIKSIYGEDKSRDGMWDSWVRGVGPPPLKTKYGWLIFYHGMDKHHPSEYKVGAMLTDLNEPTKVLHRSKAPIMEPDQVYENNGFKAGVVYVSGAVIKDGQLLVYYGASDSYICAASANLEKFLQALMKEEKLVFKTKIVKKKS